MPDIKLLAACGWVRMYDAFFVWAEYINSPCLYTGKMFYVDDWAEGTVNNVLTRFDWPVNSLFLPTARTGEAIRVYKNHSLGSSFFLVSINNFTWNDVKFLGLPLTALLSRIFKILK